MSCYYNSYNPNPDVLESCSASSWKAAHEKRSEPAKSIEYGALACTGLSCSLLVDMNVLRDFWSCHVCFLGAAEACRRLGADTSMILLKSSGGNGEQAKAAEELRRKG
jgi:hypothetical protein